jgi:hypothetical protein
MLQEEEEEEEESAIRLPMFLGKVCNHPRGNYD